MKNTKKTYFGILLSLVLFLTGSVFFALPKQKNMAYADDVYTPSYLTIFKYDKQEIEENEYTYTRTGNFINRGDAIFTNDGEVVIFRLAHPDEGQTNAIMFYSMQVFIKGQSSLIKPEYIQDYPDAPVEYMDIVFDLYSALPDEEGRYDITISYMEYTLVDGNYTNAQTRQLTYNFYLYKTSTYYSADNPAVSVANVDTYAAGSSSSFARTHEFYYNNNLPSLQKLSLPTITYDTNKFELLITKTVSGTNTQSKVTVDLGDNLVQTNDIVLLSKNDSTAIVTFNDIGSYYVQYLFVYKQDTTVEYFENINLVTKPDKINIFGFQIFHSDINSTISSSKKEFKKFESNNTLSVGYQTDITYTQIGLVYNSGELIENIPDTNLYTINYNDSRIDFNALNLVVPNTNQAPVEFNYNASIIKSESFYLKLNSYNEELDVNSWSKTIDYNGSAFTDVGTYLVKITFNSTLSLQNNPLTQWFYFKITNETPSYKVLDEQNQELNSNTFTKNQVSVQFNQQSNPFDSVSQLFVYSKDYTADIYSNQTQVPYNEIRSFGSNSNYKVVLLFGKNLTKSKVTYFTIDNTEITGISARNVALSNNYQTKNSTVSFFTNQNVSVEWNEKTANGNTITASYKFLPIIANIDNFTSTELESYYEQGYFVPVDYTLDYKKIEGIYPTLRTVPYSNTIGQNIVSTESILTQQGMYIFHLVDKAGNEKYFSFVLDKTNPVVLQKMAETNTYVTNFSSLNLIAEDAIIQWGKYKVIKTNIDLEGVDFTSWTMIDESDMLIDSWLLQVLRTKARLSQQTEENTDFKIITVNTNRNLYLTPAIQTDSVMVQIGETLTYASSTNYGGGTLLNLYSFAITVAEEVSGTTTIYENSYSFYVSDESKTDSGYSTIHNIQVSTDISKTAVRFGQTPSGLTKHSYEITNIEESIKSVYYMPISCDVLELQYLIAPTQNSIEIDKIQIKFYAYISNYLIYRGSNSMLQTNMYYTLDEMITYTAPTDEEKGLIENTSYRLDELLSKNVFSYSNFQVGTSYVLSKTAYDIIVYDYTLSINLGTLANGYYIYNINTIIDASTNKIQTQGGKYVVTRTYRDLEFTQDMVGERYDFMTRNQTFIVDREDIISAPVTLNIQSDPSSAPIYVLVSQVGGASYIEVLAGDENSNLFTEIYRARNYTNSAVKINILQTNKLPVKVSIPLFKFGQVVDNNFLVFANNLFYTDDISSYINSFEILVSVTHLPTSTVNTNAYSVRFSATTPTLGVGESYVRLDNGMYLVTSNTENGYIILPTFTAVGQYQITISQNNTNLIGNKSSVTLYLDIVNIAPAFEVEDTVGNNLNTDNSGQIYYTNKNTLRVIWTDSSNEYMAKINHNNLVYYDGIQNITVPAYNVTTLSNGLTHYFDINLTNYTDNTQMTITLSYEGDSSAYPSGSFSSSKIVKIDRIAPTSSIDKLIAKADENTVLNSSSLRQGHNQAVGYNRTTVTQNSIFKNFAFAVDISDFESLIFLSTDRVELRLKQIATKYTDASYVEIDPSNTSALTQLRYSGQYTPVLNLTDIVQLSKNTYYEVAEIDLAGNITVYSIYLSDIASYVAEEQSLKNENTNYKSTLSDDYKLVEYTNDITNDGFVSILDMTNSSYSYKIFSKNNFVLTQINAFGYPWSIITYNNTKYVYSPTLTNGIYKLTSTTPVIVELEQEILLSLARYNYLLTVKNLPKTNANISIVVSDQTLSFVEPTGTSEKMTIIRISANDTEFVNWQTLTVWEYRNGSAMRFATFENGIANPVEYSPEIEGFNLATYLVNQTNTEFTISAIIGSHYRYKIVDNFGNIYTLHHLYGQEYIEPIVSNDGLNTLYTDYEDDQMYYVSNTGFSFTFFPSITVVTLTVVAYNTDGTYSWPESTENFIIDNTSIYDNEYFRLAKYPSYTTIIMTPNQITDERFDGIKIVYFLQTTTNILDQDEPLTETEDYRFKVYNLVPTIQLKGKNRQSLNDLLLNSNNLTSEPVTVEFVDTIDFEYPVNVFVSYNGDIETQITSNTTFSEAGTYTIYRHFTGVMSAFSSPVQSFTISNAAWQFYSVIVYSASERKYIEVAPTGSPYVTEDSSTTATSIYQHYIVNTLDFQIKVNSSQYIEIIGAPGTANEDTTKYYTSVKRGISTFVRTLSNLHAIGNPTVNYYETKIAISYIPTSNKILSSFYYLNAQGNSTSLDYCEKSYALQKDVDNTNSVIISWNNHYMISENKIFAEIRYGEDNQLVSNAKITSKDEIDSITLNRSGNYQFVFRDIAGNVHKFDYNVQMQNSTSTYDFIFLKNVIFEVNENAPIPFAIYNEDVTISVPSYTLSYYDSNAKPQIMVERNGLEYNEYTSSTYARTYTFSETGLYKVTFTAKRDTKQLREEPYYFQIIKANELTWAFDIEEYEEYYIEEIIKDGIDVTQSLTNAKVGNLITINSNGCEKTYLTSLFVSLYDEQTGAGNWQIKMNTNNDLSQNFTYSFRINSAVPPISISLDEGEKTTKPITISFNAVNLYEEVGDVIIKIGNQTSITLNQEYFEQDNYQEVYNIDLTDIGDNYIQILTPSERLLFSYKVTREQPLNAVAIIVIIAGTMSVIGLALVFILLRKKMRIR